MSAVTAAAWAIGGLAVIAFIWAASRWRATAARVEEVEAIARKHVATNKVLKTIVVAKESKLAAVENKLASSASPDELVAELNRLFHK